MEEIHHNSIKSWLGALKARRLGGHELMSGDDPRRRMLGFFDHTEERHHMVSILVAKETFGEISAEEKENLLSFGGRKELVEG